MQILSNLPLRRLRRTLRRLRRTLRPLRRTLPRLSQTRRPCKALRTFSRKAGNQEKPTASSLKNEVKNEAYPAGESNASDDLRIGCGLGRIVAGAAPAKACDIGCAPCGYVGACGAIYVQPYAGYRALAESGSGTSSPGRPAAVIIMSSRARPIPVPATLHRAVSIAKRASTAGAIITVGTITIGTIVGRIITAITIARTCCTATEIARRGLIEAGSSQRYRRPLA